MGHLNHIKGKYENLLERLDSNQIGLPYPRSDKARRGWREILEILFTTEEADLASRLPLMLADINLIAKRTGIPTKDLIPRLDAMAHKGIVMDLVDSKTGQLKYMLAPPVIGFFEFSLMRAHDTIPQKRMAEALDAYCHGDDTFAKEVFSGDTVVGRSMVNEEMIEKPDILDWDSSTSLIKDAKSIAVAFCYCRHKMKHLDKSCDAPLDSCLSINGGADFIIRRGFGRQIDAYEALDIMVSCSEQGLVQIADNVQTKPSYICNCCGCCCGQLQAINEFDIDAVNPSAYLPHLFKDKCSGCAKCETACPIDAIVMDQSGVRRPIFNTDRCIGCGVCAKACGAKHAITMRKRTERSHIPFNVIEKSVRISMERGRLADLLFDYGAGRGSRFMNKLLKALNKLTPVEKLLASKQVTSIFVRAALKLVEDPYR